MVYLVYVVLINGCDGQTSSPLLRMNSRFPDTVDMILRTSGKRTVGCEAVPREYVPDGIILSDYPSSPSYLSRRHDRSLYRQRCELGNRPLQPAAFSSLPLPSILTFYLPCPH